MHAPLAKASLDQLSTFVANQPRPARAGTMKGTSMSFSLLITTRTGRSVAAITTALGLTLAFGACASSSGADGNNDAFPSQDITLTVQAAAGGGSDLASRALASVLEADLGTSVIVENRPGASGSLAVKHVAGQDADGYHIGFVPVEIAMYEHLGIDVAPDSVDLLGQILIQPGTIAVPVDSPYDTLDDLMTAAKSEKLTVSNSGAGSAWEAATKLLGQVGGVEFTLVPFDGGAPAVTAAMGNKVDAVIAGAGETHAGVENGQLRVLAIFSKEAHPVFTDIPTATEEGYELEFGSWGGIYAPKGIPADIKATLEAAIEQAAQSPAFTDVITPTGTLAEYKNSADWTDFVALEYERFGNVLGN